MSSTLQQVVDAVFKFIEQGRLPLIQSWLRAANAEVDSVLLPAFATFLEANGLGWIAAGPSPASTASPQSPPEPRVIHVINQSTEVKDAGIFTAGVNACQVQVMDDFAPKWGGLSCHLIGSSAAPGSPVKPVVETIYVLDDSDQADALGYHELTDGDIPVGFVFADTSEQFGSPWTVTLSHELLEQLADPYIATAVITMSFQGRPAAIAYEVADPVEEYTYKVDGVELSDFVLPTWFQDETNVSRPCDFMGLVNNPLVLGSGGYAAYTRDLSNWQQLIRGPMRPHREGVLPYCRRFKRFWRGRGAKAMAMRPGGVAGMGQRAEEHGIARETVAHLVSQHGPAAAVVVDALLADLSSTSRQA